MARRSRTGSKTSKAKAGTAKAKRRIVPKATPRKGRSVSDLQEQRDRYFNELKEAREQQAASAEILKVINASPGDQTPVFEIILEKAHSLCDVTIGCLELHEGDRAYSVAVRGVNRRWEQFLRLGYKIDDGNRKRLQAVHPIQIVDACQILERSPDNTSLRAMVEIGGLRGLLALPLIKDGRVFGRIIAARDEVRPFTNHQIALLQSFADQAVIAISNVELFNEVKERTKELSQSLDDLRAAQDRLVQTEKLASLGQLTAGIAHEIKNPLNFVNNFSALSAELVAELDETLAPAPLDQKMRGDVGELSQMLKSNLEKVVQHGKRADSIVKNMLLHSREGTGERRSAAVNALVEESLNLAYHGARAEKPDFNIILKHDLDPDAGEIDLYPQEITRALLNLISNGFHAAAKRKAEAGDETFEPALTAATKNLGKSVEIRIRDNGTGIRPDVKEKMFNPFFTTKPTGEGTGLGLSMSHDIIVKQHGGRIDVETEPGVFTEFIITLPRNGQAASDRKPE